jgi:tetrahydromethanopterin S-methyltransferase subunit A
MARGALDGPAKQGKVSVTTGAVVEVKVGGTAFAERGVITLQPLGGTIRIYFADEGIVPSIANVQDDGVKQFKNQIMTYEATDSQAVYMIAESATTDVIVIERA